MRANRLSDEELGRAGALVGARCGLRFDEANRGILEQGLWRAAESEGTSTAELLARLQDAPSDALVQSVLRQVTIGETYLFRHPEHFAAIREVVVPERMSARAAGRELRAWSAGCATGEEAWSLAMTLRSGAGAGWRVSVLGTDINKRALETARSGRYGAWSVRSTLPCPTGMTRPLSDGGLQIAPWLHEGVRFDYLNLHDPIYPSLFTGTQGLDLIVCRNVLVYFLADAATQVLARLRDCLADGGWLLVGALDVDRAPPELERVQVDGVTLLRKRRVARTTPPSLPATTRAAAPAAERKPAPRTDDARRLLGEARAAAERGALAQAIELGRAALAADRAPGVLHFLALLLGEQGSDDERVTLLREVVARAPDDALAHLALGMTERSGTPEIRRAHLDEVLRLVARRLDGERLVGPEPLPVGWVRKVATAALRRLKESAA
jgi:chemotaxis protein methyltransferase CheR